MCWVVSVVLVDENIVFKKGIIKMFISLTFIIVIFKENSFGIFPPEPTTFSFAFSLFQESKGFKY